MIKSMQNCLKASHLLKFSMQFMGMFLAYALSQSANASQFADGGILSYVTIESIIFALMLLGIAIFYKQTLQVALIGLVILVSYKYIFTDNFSVLNKLFGEKGSWMSYANLALMLPGFAILADIFTKSKLPSIFPKYIPNGALGGVFVLGTIFILSTFLDNIAAAMIGGSMAYAIYKGNVHIGFVAAICAAANAGGVGSVVGDTTTTLMWIDGKNPLVLAQAFLPAIVAMAIVAYFASRQQQKYYPLTESISSDDKIDSKKLFSVFLILVGAISFNYLAGFPALGIWLALIVSHFFSKVDFSVVKSSYESTTFLIALVFSASLVPIDTLPDATALSTYILGCISAVFNNIPLTELCLIKGGYDWPLMSYAVGFGGSMVWFGSSAGVAVCEMFIKARSFLTWVKYGWHVAFGFTVGFIVYLVVLGWNPYKGNPDVQVQQQDTVQTEQVVTN